MKENNQQFDSQFRTVTTYCWFYYSLIPYEKKYLKLILISFLWFVAANTVAQSYIGLSVNYGDRLTFTPHYNSFLLNRSSFSPTIVYSNQKKFRSGFSAIFGGQVGIAGYQLVPVLSDTLGPSGDRAPFVDYGIFLSRLEVTPGKELRIGKKELFIGLGIGVSYYLVFPYTTMDVLVIYQGREVNVFSSYMEASPSGTFIGFAKVYTKIQISNRIELALQYSKHWQSILNGEFEFYHTRTPASGTIKLVPQGISLVLLYRLKSKST